MAFAPCDAPPLKFAAICVGAPNGDDAPGARVDWYSVDPAANVRTAAPFGSTTSPTTVIVDGKAEDISGVAASVNDVAANARVLTNR